MQARTLLSRAARWKVLKMTREFESLQLYNVITISLKDAAGISVAIAIL
jgi:hypothetical protein